MRGRRIYHILCSRNSCHLHQQVFLKKFLSPQSYSTKHLSCVFITFRKIDNFKPEIRSLFLTHLNCGISANESLIHCHHRFRAVSWPEIVDPLLAFPHELRVLLEADTVSKSNHSG